MTAPARFPLRPGRPLVFRRPNGAWGYSCDCVGHGRMGGPVSCERHNCDDWAQALREALDHVRYWHLSPAELETRALEALYALPAVRERTLP